MWRPNRASASAIRKATGAIVHRSPGRARHKPSNHCAGKAGCLASPVSRCAAFFSTRFAQWTAGASRHPAFPAPSAFSEGGNGRKARADDAARTRDRAYRGPAVRGKLGSRAPDVTQHQVMRCRAGAHASALRTTCWVPAAQQRFTLQRVRDTRGTNAAASVPSLRAQSRVPPRRLLRCARIDVERAGVDYSASVASTNPRGSSQNSRITR